MFSNPDVVLMYKIIEPEVAGGNRGGGYIEFTVPKWGVTPTPYISGTGNSGRIIVEGHMQLNITTLNPKYVKRWWWPFS